jgi:hypothetical protein
MQISINCSDIKKIGCLNDSDSQEKEATIIELENGQWIYVTYDVTLSIANNKEGVAQLNITQ